MAAYLTLEERGADRTERRDAGSLPVISARDIWFSYDRRAPVLRGLSLDVEAGAITMVLGRSGSGKTTLLKVLKGLLRPNRGSVQVNTGVIRNGSRPGSRVAYVPQTLGLVRSMSALDNTLTGALSRVGTARSLAKMFPRQIIDEANETIASLGLAHKVYETVHKLSGGERQRIAIARALMQHPTLILADEFVSQLDPITAEEILEMMVRIARNQGVGMLVTTHETDVVEIYGDRVIIMAEGRIVRDSPGGTLAAGEITELLR